MSTPIFEQGSASSDSLHFNKEILPGPCLILLFWTRNPSLMNAIQLVDREKTCDGVNDGNKTKWAFISQSDERQKQAVELGIEWTTPAFEILAVSIWHPSSVLLRAFRKREGWESNLLKPLRWIKNQGVTLVVLGASSRTDLVYWRLVWSRRATNNCMNCREHLY